MLEEKINQEIVKALKAGDQVRLSTLKLLSAELHKALIAKKREPLTVEEENLVVKKEVRRRKDAIEAFNKVGAKERAQREEAELQVLTAFLPEEMSREEIEKAVEATIKELGATSLGALGQVMGEVMKKLAGKADGSLVAEVAKEKLS